MKLKIVFSIVAVGFMATSVLAQHSDVELGYDNLSNPTAFIIEQDNVTTEGFQYFEAEMEELDPFDPGNFSSDEPGFATNGLEGLLVNEGDQIWLNILDASVDSSFGLGYVNYYDPNTDTLQASGRIAVEDNSTGTLDLILNGSFIESGPNPQFIDLGDSAGDIHDHLLFDLLDDATAPMGAYGFLVQLQSDFDVADGTMDLSSDPFWMIYNHGMTDVDFDQMALPAFGVAEIPEPGAAALLILGTSVMALRRRKRA